MAEDRIIFPHASVVESMGVCVLCGLPASDPGPCEKRPSRYLSVGNETYDSEGGGAGTYRDRSSAYPSDHIGFGDCGCDVCCPEPGPPSVARNQVSAAKPENDGGDFKSGARSQNSTVRALLDLFRDTVRFFWRYPDRMIAAVFQHYFGDPERAKRIIEEMPRLTVAADHSTVIESMGICVFCGLTANDPGPCQGNHGSLTVTAEKFDPEKPALEVIREITDKELP